MLLSELLVWVFRFRKYENIRCSTPAPERSKAFVVRYVWRHRGLQHRFVLYGHVLDDVLRGLFYGHVLDDVLRG